MGEDKWLVKVGESRPPNGDTPSAGPVYRNVVAKDGFPQLEVVTLYELFERSVKLYGERRCLGRREVVDGVAGDFQWWTYAETGARVGELASALTQLGVKPQDRVGILSQNNPEWMVAMQACNRNSLHCVPLYDSLGENAIEYIVNHSETVLAFVSAPKLPQLVKALDRVQGTLKTVVTWGTTEADAKLVEAVANSGLKVLTYEEALQLGAAHPSLAVPPKPEDLSTIMYTSGTTGDPKGVMITHAAVLATVSTLSAYMKQVDTTFGEGDSMLSFLPLAHIFDRSAEELFLYLGAQLGYWQGDPLKLVDDIGALKPALFIAVPRVFDRIYSRVSSQIASASPVARWLFKFATARKLHFLQMGRRYDKATPFFDNLVFNKIKQRLGGQVRLITSGGAPLAPHVEDFLRVAMCCPVTQGYGLTETCAASFISVPGDYGMAGTVGPPLPCTEFRLESVPEMEYDALDPNRPAGEVLIRGPNLFNGYYKDDDKTAEVLDADGWFHTGDIAVLTPSGGLRIVDRKKNIFKLSIGEYIAAEKLEAAFKSNTIVEQIWIYGNSFKNSLLGVVVPTPAALEEAAKSLGVTGSPAEQARDAKVVAHFLKELQATGRAEKLKSFELIKGLLLETEPFAVENELLTPTFKLKRPQLQKRYQADIDTLYKALGE